MYVLFWKFGGYVQIYVYIPIGISFRRLDLDKFPSKTFLLFFWIVFVSIILFFEIHFIIIIKFSLCNEPDKTAT